MSRLCVVEDASWYETIRMADGITLIHEPWIKPFYRCNIWHVRGRDRDMLVDSGMGVVSLREWVPLVTERALTAVASHTHFDHIGCHHDFDCRCVHAAEADLLAHPTRKNTLADPYVTDEIFDALPPEPYASATYAVKAAPATRLLEDGDHIDLGDRVFEVIHTPGHSPGGIALFELYAQGRIDMEEALHNADSANNLRIRIKNFDLRQQSGARGRGAGTDDSSLRIQGIRRL